MTHWEIEWHTWAKWGVVALVCWAVIIFGIGMIWDAAMWLLS